MVEVAKEKGDYTPELSFGTHFFQDLVETEIRYLPLYPDEQKNVFNEDIVFTSENHLSKISPSYKNFENVIHVMKVSDVVSGGTLSVIMDGEAGDALAYLKPPDHWSWRKHKVEEMAKSLDPDVYGIEALYVIGSTKDGSAGPASDIDLLVHFKGNEDQKERLLDWFEKWGKKLGKENKERTGLETGGLLDVHIITDKDIKNKTSWASHITSPYMTVKKILLDKEDS